MTTINTKKGASALEELTRRCTLVKGGTVILAAARVERRVAP